MDLLLRLMQPRAGAAVLAAAAALWAGFRWSGAITSRAELALHPPAPAAAESPMARALAAAAETRESARLRGLHRDVSAEIEAARGRRGFDADLMQKAADAVLQLDRPFYRAAATERLNKLRLAVPPAPEAFRAAAKGERSPDLSRAPLVPEPKAVPGFGLTPPRRLKKKAAASR